MHLESQSSDVLSILFGWKGLKTESDTGTWEREVADAKVLSGFGASAGPADTDPT